MPFEAETGLRVISPRVFLYEAGRAPHEVQGGWLALPYLPSPAFGDGSHPTTRLCAGAVDFLCRQKKLAGVLDVGTGTGVLARIARARGAAFVVGTDIDPVALAAAEKNAALDLHAPPIQLSAEEPNHWGPVFELVVANILEAPLRGLAPKLAEALAPGALLLISGFTRLQTAGLRVTFTAEGLSHASESHLDEWALLSFRRN